MQICKQTPERKRHTKFWIYCIFILGNLKNLSLIDKFKIEIRKMNFKACFAVCLAENRFRWKNVFQVLFWCLLSWWGEKGMSLHDRLGTFTCDHRGLTELFHVRTCKAMALPLVRAAKRTHRMWWKCGAERLADFKGVYFPRAEN